MKKLAHKRVPNLNALQKREHLEEGMATVEYAIGTLAAAAFAGLLLAVINGGSIQDFLTNLIQRALSV